MILEHLVVSPKPLEPTKLRFHPADFMAYDPSLEVAWNASAQRELNPDDLTKFKVEEPHNLDLAILRVNKQLNAEATELLTKKNTVAIRITEGNINILGHMIARNVKLHQSTLKDCSRFHKFQLHIQHQIDIHRILGEDQSLKNVGTNTHQISKLKNIVANKSIEVFLGGHEGPDSKHVKRIQFHCRNLLKAKKLTWNEEEETLDPASTTQDARMIEWECRYWATREKRRWIDSRWFDGVRGTCVGHEKEQAVWDMALAVNARDEKRWIDAWGRHVATQKVQTWRLIERF